MSSTTTCTVVLVICLAACDCDEGSPSPQPTATERAEATRAEPPPVAPEAPPTPPANEPRPDVDVDGLTARRSETGHIEVRGTDRWGGRVDTTYESAEYLKNALPVLERSITEAQASALREWVESLETE